MMEKELLNLRGIITVLNTPFTSDLQLDLESMRRNVQWAMNCGVAGFLVPAMASEVGKLTPEEKMELVRCTIQTLAGQVPVIGGASAPTRQARVEITRELIKAGCEGILINIPFENEQQYEEEVVAIAELDPPFLMLQDWDFSGFGLPVPLIVHLFEKILCFRALKVEVVPAGVKYTKVLKETQGKLHLSGGWAVNQLVEGLDRGVHAFMPTGMHRIYTHIYDLYSRGNRDLAQALFYDLLPVLAFSNQHLDISIHFFKHLLHTQGVFSTPLVRPPSLPFDTVHQNLARELIDRVTRIEAEIETGMWTKGYPERE